MQQRLMLGRRPLRAKPGRHRLHRLALAWQQQADAVPPERLHPILVPETPHKSLDIRREPRFTALVAPLKIHRCP